MSIFNSLGSNYSGSFVWRSLLGSNSKTAKSQLETALTDYYKGSVTLTYKGRQALQLALLQSGLSLGSSVGINGFTCYVVYQAVERAGYKPVFIDLAEDELNFGVGELSATREKHHDLKAIIIQNTLGLPAPIDELADYCKKHNMLIIEDLAHSLGLIYANGQEAGKVGQLTMLSFSQDKPLDVVAGGALINRLKDSPKLKKLKQAGPWVRSKNRSYPFWTAMIRSTYSIGLGRYLHFGLKKAGLMATPMSDNVVDLSEMTRKAHTLLLERWQQRESEFEHRRKISNIYRMNLPKTALFKDLSGAGSPLYLRFPLKVQDRRGLVSYLKLNQIYIGDTWYDAPVAPKKYLRQTNYDSGQCPRAEKIIKEIVNLPTHINVSEEQARDIAGKVSQWLKST